MSESERMASPISGCLERLSGFGQQGKCGIAWEANGGSANDENCLRDQPLIR